MAELQSPPSESVNFDDEEVVGVTENKFLRARMETAREKLRDSILSEKISKDELEKRISELRDCVGVLNKEITNLKQSMTIVSGEYTMHCGNMETIAEKRRPEHGFVETSLSGLCREQSGKMKSTSSDMENTELAIKKIESGLINLTHVSENITGLLQTDGGP